MAAPIRQGAAAATAAAAAAAGVGAAVAAARGGRVTRTCERPEEGLG